MRALAVATQLAEMDANDEFLEEAEDEIRDDDEEELDVDAVASDHDSQATTLVWEGDVSIWERNHGNDEATVHGSSERRVINSDEIDNNDNGDIDNNDNCDDARLTESNNNPNDDNSVGNNDESPARASRTY